MIILLKMFVQDSIARGATVMRGAASSVCEKALKTWDRSLPEKFH